MTYWKIYLFLIDKINDVEFKVKHKISPLYTYSDLYHQLPNIYENVKSNYTMNNITFKLCSYMEEPVKINNWRKFILNKDRIRVIIYDPTKLYYGLFTESDDMVIQSSKIETIYEDIQYNHVNETLLIYMIDQAGEKQKLVDIIDNPKRHYNALINRMVKKGWY